MINLWKFSLQDLQGICTEMSVSAEGTKSEVIARLTEHFSLDQIEILLPKKEVVKTKTIGNFYKGESRTSGGVVAKCLNCGNK